MKGNLEDHIDELKQSEYDFIIVSGLLHEVENPLELLQAVNCLASKKCTYVHINVPNAYSLHRIIAFESGKIDTLFNLSERNQCLQQHTVFSMEALKNLVLESLSSYKTGAILECGSYFIKPFTHAQMEQCLKLEIIDSSIIEGCNNLIKYMPDYGSEIYVNYKL